MIYASGNSLHKALGVNSEYVASICSRAAVLISSYEVKFTLRFSNNCDSDGKTKLLILRLSIKLCLSLSLSLDFVG